MIRRVNPTEHQIQSAIVKWASTATCEGINGIKIGNFLIAIPNGGYRNKFEAKRLKEEGVKAGVSDLFLALPAISTTYSLSRFGLWIEVKATKGKLSDAQHGWISLMKTANYEAVCVHSVDDGIKAIKDYLGMR